MSGAPRNRLRDSLSPYLLQHASNPVDWYPWGEEALARAKKENKPIFLSIGYAACHWCHVMERESFENERIAKLMNDRFVNIKVDREERPDLDEIYMNATVALSAVKGGAQDYLVKSRLDRELLLRSMHYSIERKRYQVQLEHQANYDALTGLPNRNLLHDRLRQAVYSQRVPRSIAVVFMDLDHYKFVNDSLGHSTGDLLLKAMAERLRSVLREGDTVGRVGGDEFVLILNDQSNEEIIYRAMQRITAKVCELRPAPGSEIRKRVVSVPANSRRLSSRARK